MWWYGGRTAVWWESAGMMTGIYCHQHSVGSTAAGRWHVEGSETKTQKTISFNKAFLQTLSFNKALLQTL
jgi:hypothetical protein